MVPTYSLRDVTRHLQLHLERRRQASVGEPRRMLAFSSPGQTRRLHDWEWVMGKFVQALARDTFDVIVPKDLVYRHKVFNQTIGLTHGDGVKAQAFAGIPWYSMKQRRDAMPALLKSLGLEQLDLLIYGHFHQLIYEEGSGCSLLINGSIKGYDEYILKTKYSGQTPIQALLTFHPRHGLTDLSRINLGHIQSAAQAAPRIAA